MIIFEIWWNLPFSKEVDETIKVQMELKANSIDEKTSKKSFFTKTSRMCKMLIDKIEIYLISKLFDELLVSLPLILAVYPWIVETENKVQNTL